MTLTANREPVTEGVVVPALVPSQEEIYEALAYPDGRFLDIEERARFRRMAEFVYRRYVLRESAIEIAALPGRPSRKRVHVILRHALRRLAHPSRREVTAAWANTRLEGALRAHGWEPE